MCIMILTTILFLEWTFTHYCYGDFEGENSDLSRSLAANQMLA